MRRPGLVRRFQDRRLRAARAVEDVRGDRSPVTGGVGYATCGHEHRQMRRTRVIAPVTHDPEHIPVLSSCQDTNAITLESPRWLYKTSVYVPAFDNEFASPTDLEVFMGVFRKGVTDATFTVEEVNGGGYDPSNPGIEANHNV
ncbi:hypothetical protein EDB92DRAFT_1876660 [Lactarius akahatsu]|uniref:Uncharacterized protein n=1 Tax=Lactarius akahatsu TaxID=416441 RepID=A0AAD4LD61_9AGAM|nr:hypothetical protein EDB92DRAFT_1876660 [Lactarius akahatsu]